MKPWKGGRACLLLSDAACIWNSSSSIGQILAKQVPIFFERSWRLVILWLEKGKSCTYLQGKHTERTIQGAVGQSISLWFLGKYLEVVSGHMKERKVIENSQHGYQRYHNLRKEIHVSPAWLPSITKCLYVNKGRAVDVITSILARSPLLSPTALFHSCWHMMVWMGGQPDSKNQVRQWGSEGSG